MRGRANPELKAECIQLRVGERMSLREIHARTGASKGSLSGWLKEHPLTDEEISERAHRNRYRTPKKDRGAESRLYRQTRAPLSKMQKAKVAEAATLLRLVLHGFNVFCSPFDGDKADWVIEGSNGFLKAQVKWVSQKKTGLPIVSLKGGGRNLQDRRYVEGDFDILVGYDLFTDTCYVWTWDEVKHFTTGVTICPEANEAWGKLRR